MTGWRLSALNVALPGAGLLIDGQLAAGLLLLVPSIILLALALGVLGLFTAAAALPIVGTLVAVYAVLSLVAGGWWWRCLRRRRYDPQQVRLLHREACAAWLQGRAAEALTKSRGLVAIAPEESGAWRFLALVAGDAGDATTARRAEARAQSIDDR